jgi:hypothetical protein
MRLAFNIDLSPLSDELVAEFYQFAKRYNPENPPLRVFRQQLDGRYCVLRLSNLRSGILSSTALPLLLLGRSDRPFPR